MLGIWSFPLSLLLSTAWASSEFPDFGEDSDWHDDWYVCEGDGCADSHTYIYIDKDVQVPNRSVTYEEYEYFDVDTAGLLADCAPSLSVGDIATSMKSCREVDYKFQKACNYRAKGWLDKDGKTVKEGLDKDFKEIAGASENIMKCLGWDGVAEYEYGYYNYYDYYDYYDYLEESDDIQVRRKRDQISNVPEFLTQSNRKKRSIKNKGNGESETIKKPKNGKGHNGGHGGKHRGKFGKNRKNKNRNKRKSKHQGKKSSRRGGKQGSKSGKQRKKHSRKSGKSSKKSGKGSGKSKKKKHRSGKKGNGRKNKNQKKKEEREKKKKEKKILKQIGYNSEPSEETLNKLRCVERAIMFGLEKCGEKIFQNLDIP